MSPSQETRPRSLRHASRKAAWAALRGLLRTRIMAGVLTLLPIWITWTVVVFLFNTMRNATEPLARWVTEEYAKNPKSPLPAFLKEPINPEGESRLDWIVPFVAVLLTLFFLYLLGFCTSHLFGRRVLAGMERLVDRVPIAKTVYRLTKQVITTMAGETELSRSRVVLVELYQPGTRCIGFLTSVMKSRGPGPDLCTVFIASTPNPAVGYTYIVPFDRVHETDWTMEEAIKIVVSGGAAAPATVALRPSSGVPTPPHAGREAGNVGAEPLAARDA